MAIARINDVRQYGKQVVCFKFSFRTKAGQNPDAIRDGSAKFVSSVTRSGGVYTITFKSPYNVGNFPIPQQITYANCNLNSSATPTKFGDAYYVKNSYDPVARTMQVAVAITSQAGGASSIAEPDDGDWIGVEITGPGIATFKDAV